jgi:hypothetical protein
MAGETTRKADARTGAKGRPAHCEFCREQIVWCEWMPNPRARTKKGPQLVPVDPEPNDRIGLLVMTPRPGDRPLVGEMSRNQAAGYREHGCHTYVQHIKTCTKADELKRKVVARNRKTS